MDAMYSNTMILTKKQKDRAFALTSQGRGGLLLSEAQRRVLIDSAARHFENEVNRRLQKPTKEDLVQLVKNDPIVKQEIKGFILVTIIAAIIGWIVTTALDYWWDEYTARLLRILQNSRKDDTLRQG